MSGFGLDAEIGGGNPTPVVRGAGSRRGLFDNEEAAATHIQVPFHRRGETRHGFLPLVFILCPWFYLRPSADGSPARAYLDLARL